ncbi:hypothetical protein B0F90DRAFT_1807827 [Multifurca ochricompacta]|uniref:Uncharacterized protein n=1 Tax=Multifurca ochricompacta TaxID=376703 RepID=A0AAD4QQZ3_9AGAM|nr:hypothetical protein B0F90DRAFT_1807827 [Multifurca ochricompacta]
MAEVKDQKLSIQAFLQVLTSKHLPISRAMTVASKIYKDFNTPTRLGQLTDSKLISLGVLDKEDRRLVLLALNAAGYRAIAVTNAKQQEAKKRRIAHGTSIAHENMTGESSILIQASQPSPQKKRKRGAFSDLENDFFASDEGAAFGSLVFHELLDEDMLKHKSVVVNRAPIMMAWACVVAERLGFSREEALSIASVYTSMNAINKGVSLGIYDKKREVELKAAQAGGAQPYVDLLSRRVPLYCTATGSWRGFTTEDSGGGGGASPAAAYGYITRALRQTTPAVLGAMYLLAQSYSDPMELNRMGFSLYADFRPDVNEWGKRGELRCETLLGLRKKRSGSEFRCDKGNDETGTLEDVVKTPAGKKPKPDQNDSLGAYFHGVDTAMTSKVV